MVKKSEKKRNTERNDDERLNAMDEKQRLEYLKEFYNRRRYNYFSTGFVRNRLKIMVICSIIVLGYVFVTPDSNEPLDLLMLPFLFAFIGFVLALDHIFLIRYYYKRHEYLRKEIFD